MCCGKQEKVDRVIENGVEVVRNKLRPYVIGRVPRNFQVDKRVLIDFQSEEIVKLGIADIRGFDVDLEGNIYISVFKGEYCIYKFDPEGSFVISFARKGQGPGEMPIAKSLIVNDRNEVVVADVAKQKLVFFDNHGMFLKEIGLPHRLARLLPLPDGNYLISIIVQREVPSPFYYLMDLSIYDPDLREIRRLDQLRIPNGPGASYWLRWNDRIYVGSEDRGYDIWVYDLNGRLIRKIKKESAPVKVPEDIRTLWKSAFESLKLQARSSEDFRVPQNWPPFEAFFVDDEGRLCVRTFEAGPQKGEYVHDIFDSHGVFIGRKAFDLIFDREFEYVRLKNGKIYGFSENPSGFEQLSVYQLKWE